MYIVGDGFPSPAIENGWIPEWPKGADCKSVAIRFGGSNPPSSTKNVSPVGGAFFRIWDLQMVILNE